MSQRPKKLLEQVQDVIRLKHYSYQEVHSIHEKRQLCWMQESDADLLLLN